ncbi:MAG: hypothetical protein IKG22_15205 [Atopobiaceae bacterium]|nr:hypothetical protein [Atopobiaceae bacterium]
MTHGIYSIKSHTAFGNMAIGVCLVALSATRIIGPNSWLGLCMAVCLLAFSSLSLFVCLSPRREKPDEMSMAHDGVAAGHALRTTLAVTCLACVAGLITNIRVDAAALCLGIIGFGLLVYGTTFAWLER